MNKLFGAINVEYLKGKKIYTFLLLILIIGTIVGSLFITILSKEDKTLVINQIIAFFKQIKSNDIDYLLVLKNSIFSNLLSITFIWLLGISIIGIPFIIFVVFIKGFIVGFSIASIIAQYKLIGILGSITYIFPHMILSILVVLYLSCYALDLSFNLFWAIIQKKTINFKEIVNKYLYVFLISTLVMVVCSLIEVFISPYLIKFFLLFVKL